MENESATASTALQSISLADLLPPRLHAICFGPSIGTMLRQGAGAAEHVAITAGGKIEEAGELALSLPHVSVASATRRLRWATVDSARAPAQSYRPPSPHDKVPERLAEVIAPILPYLSHGKEQLVNGLRKLEGGGELYVPCIDSNGPLSGMRPGLSAMARPSHDCLPYSLAGCCRASEQVAPRLRKSSKWTSPMSTRHQSSFVQRATRWPW